ncbi:MAG: CAP domain-containing protein [Deltaproteobacteria bacterium]|nr:CAP domain-containing protein [Deltaproteobacteria bacterium]
MAKIEKQKAIFSIGRLFRFYANRKRTLFGLAWSIVYLSVIACDASVDPRSIALIDAGGANSDGSSGMGGSGDASIAGSGGVAGSDLQVFDASPLTADAAAVAGNGGSAAVDSSLPIDAQPFDSGLNDGANGSAGTGAGGSGGSAGTSGPPPANADEVCARWNADRANRAEGTWSGNVSGCDPGDISEEGRTNALRLVNLYRWLADLPAVTTDPEFNRHAQACALIMRANNRLSHTPDQSWLCWTEEGAEGAGSCNISSGPLVQSVDGYMIDMGNPTTIGHRRWILSNMFGPTGLGATDRSSCMWTMGQRGTANKPWIAFPSPGVVPFELFGYGGWSNLDQTGWTVQSDTINLSTAQVEVTSDGAPLTVAVTQLLPNYGSRYAIRFNPQGWQAQAGKTYAVSVTGIATPIQYELQVVQCN